MNAPPLPVLDRFAAIVGAQNAARDPNAIAPYLIEPRDRFHGRTPLVLRPGSVAEVAAILALANETRTAIVPQGGNTGVVGGQTPSEKGDEIVVSLSRLARIRAVDADSYTMTVDAGVILANAQKAADAADRLFPLSLASEGSCQIGGNISTNAGGTAVLAYGNTRDLVLGLEAVLPSGEIFEGLRTLRKDNTGYDLKDLFIGAEGTLGIVTAVALKLFPKPRGVSVAFVGLRDPAAALALFHVAPSHAGGGLTAAEIMPRIALDTVLQYVPGTRDPLAGRHAWHLLLEVSSLRSQDDAEAAVEAIFVEGMEKGVVEDGARAQSLEQAAQFWRIRHSLSEVQKHLGGSIKHDVAVPVGAVPELIARASTAMTGLIPGSRPFPFGHLGDGNIHLNLSQPPGMDNKSFLDRWYEVNERVHAIVIDLGGTISAEHGIGRLKRDLLAKVKGPVEMDLMRRIKATLDPNGIMNPGKVL
ncbi:MAG: FAD-binding oxidoreductase, partial [Bauldia sp.]|nr:FAD-binding oxidoreductase [Bauldia sp.]